MSRIITVPAAKGLIGPLPVEPLALLGLRCLRVAIVNVLDSTEVVTFGGGVGVSSLSGGGALLGLGGGVGVCERYRSWGSMAGTADGLSLPGIGWFLEIMFPHMI